MMFLQLVQAERTPAELNSLLLLLLTEVSVHAVKLDVVAVNRSLGTKPGELSHVGAFKPGKYPRGCCQPPAETMP
jgi:hypothetical protein